MPGQRDTQPAARSLWRREFGDGSGTLAGVFRHLAANPQRYGTRTDPAQGLFSSRVDVASDAGSGFYRFLSIGDRILCGITDCTTLDERHEEVRDEGFVEVHFQIEGPARMSWDAEDGGAPEAPGGGDHPVHEATMIALRCAPDMTYSVRFPAGSYRLLGIYVTPQMLRDSFGLSARGVERFMNPPPGEIPLIERKIDAAFVRALQALWDIPFDGPRDLMRASAKLTEIICLVADALDESDEGAQSFSQRDLEMFQRAREILATDFSRNYSASSLARELGTNATKLKAGFKVFFGTTIFEFRKRYRMDYALTLLEKGEMSIAEIAHTAGYKRQASFTSAFKLHFGVLPSSARQGAAGAAPPGQGDDDGSE